MRLLSPACPGGRTALGWRARCSAAFLGSAESPSAGQSLMDHQDREPLARPARRVPRRMPRGMSRLRREADRAARQARLLAVPHDLRDLLRRGTGLTPFATRPPFPEGLFAMTEVGLSETLGALDPSSPRYATEVVDAVLARARAADASDVHLHPGPEGLEIRWRIDGVLQPVAVLPARLAPNVVARLKVLAELLTYRTDIPQEGRIRGVPGEVGDAALHVSHPARREAPWSACSPAPAGSFAWTTWACPPEVRDSLSRGLDETSGAVILSGPAGSGKTTTLYACLRELVGATEGRAESGVARGPDRVGRRRGRPGAGQPAARADPRDGPAAPSFARTRR